MTRYGSSQRTGTILVQLGSTPTLIQCGLFDEAHNPQNSFYEDELQYWYVLLTTEGSPLSGKTVHLRWGLMDVTAITGAGGSPGYAIIRMASYEWGFVGQMTVDVQFDGDATYASASTSETLTILGATATPTEIRYSLTDGTNTERTRFNPTDRIRFWVQLVIAGSYTPVTNADMWLEIETYPEEWETIFIGKTSTEGWLPVIEMQASDLGIGSWNWRLTFPGMVVYTGTLTLSRVSGTVRI